MPGEVHIRKQKKYVTEGVFRHWNKLPIVVTGSPSLEVFKRLLDVALGDVIER